MEFTDINNKSQSDLNQLLADKRAELRHLRFQAQSRQLKQVKKLGEVKQTIARILTVLTTLNAGNK